MATQQESDSISKAIDALTTATEHFQQEIESVLKQSSNSVSIPGPIHPGTLGLVKRVLGLLQQQKDILVLLDNKLYEIRKRSP